MSHYMSPSSDTAYHRLMHLYEPVGIRCDVTPIVEHRSRQHSLVTGPKTTAKCRGKPTGHIAINEIYNMHIDVPISNICVLDIAT